MEKKRYKPITRRGYNRIAEEHRQLLEEERPKVVDGVATAAAEGDRSENAEYIYGKKKLREIDKRLRYLTSLIKDADIVDPENVRSETIIFGATVDLLDEESNKTTYTLVGMGEANPDEKTISWQSPIAKALLGKRVGDYVEVKIPKGFKEFEIIDIRFQALR